MALRCLNRLKSFKSLLLKSSSVCPIVLVRNYGVLSAIRNEKLLENKNCSKNNFLSLRHNYKKGGKGRHVSVVIRLNGWNKTTLISIYFQEIEDDSDDEEFADDIDKQKIAKIRVQSMRADLLLKTGLGIARNKIEASFYEGKIRVNGKKINKKSVHVSWPHN
jgi:hypothetical protein